MSSPQLSIIIVNWNGRRWLDRCLRSLRAQTWRDFEVILVDNDSTDDSVTIARRDFPDMIVVESGTNVGFAAGNSLGLGRARGELIMLLNNDTWVGPEFLGTIMAEYRDGGADVIGARESSYDGDRSSSWVNSIDIFGYPVILRSEGPNDRRRFYLAGTCLLFSRRLYEETGGLDPNFFMYFEETDWFWRLQLMKKTFRSAEKALVHHAGVGSTGRGLKYKIFLWRNQNNPQMLLKNYAAPNLLWVMPLYLLTNVVEVLFCLVVLRPDLAWSYPCGWWFNLRHLRRTLAARSWVQARRLVSDREIMSKMYPWPGKLRHLFRTLARKFARHR